MLKKNRKKDDKFKKKGQTPPKKRDEKSYFAVTRKRRRRNLMIIVPPIIIIGVIFAYAISSFTENLDRANPNYGAVGSAHVHGALLVKINGMKVDFSSNKYQHKSDYIHVENGDGNTLHRHAIGVPVKEFFDSVRMNVTDDCFTLDNRTDYCGNGLSNLAFYINGNETNSIADYVIDDDDRILIAYGKRDEFEIKQDLDELRLTEIKK